jgi:hypothetical protein
VGTFDPALSVSEFRTRFPEFASAPDALVTAKLSLVSLTLDPDVWGSKAHEGAYLLCAHYLAVSPFGMQARLSASGVSIYQQTFDVLKVAVAFGYRNT